MAERSLEERWTTEFRSISAASPKDAAFVFRQLVAAHRTPPRAYHNLVHVAHCLDELATLASPEQSLLALALWFHDAIYEAPRSDNEVRSAEMAAAALRPWLPEPSLQLIQRLILATRHQQPAVDPLAATIMDIDLAILGQPWPRYDRYARAIRMEYAQVAEADYRQGRAAVLRSFLARPRLYQTEAFVRLETPARSNLEREIAALESSLGLPQATIPAG